MRRLCAGKYLNFLIADHLEFLCQLCQVRPECGSLLQAALLRHAAKLNKVSAFIFCICNEASHFNAFFVLLFFSSSSPLSQHSIRSVLRLLWRTCAPMEQEQEQLATGDAAQAAVLQALQLLSRLHQLHAGQRALQLPMERLAQRLVAQSGAGIRSSIYERLLQGELAGDEDQDEWRTML